MHKNTITLNASILVPEAHTQFNPEYRLNQTKPNQTQIWIWAEFQRWNEQQVINNASGLHQPSVHEAFSDLFSFSWPGSGVWQIVHNTLESVISGAYLKRWPHGNQQRTAQTWALMRRNPLNISTNNHVCSPFRFRALIFMWDEMSLFVEARETN